MSLHSLGNISLFATLAAAGVGMIIATALLSAIEIVTNEALYVEFGAPPTLEAASWAVFDPETGNILASKDPDTVRTIASVTKLPAATVLTREFTIDATTTVAATDTMSEGRAGRLSAGDVYSVRTLLFPLLLESSNDAAATLVRTHADLIDRMNEYASALGLLGTVFHDASGLSDKNVSTARELASLAHDVYLHDRYVLDITHIPYYLSETNGWMNNSPFIALEGYIGGKHGYTPQAGHTAIAFFAERIDEVDTQPIGYVILGSVDLSGDVSALRAYVQTHVNIR